MKKALAVTFFVLAMTCKLAPGEEPFNPHLRFAKGDVQHVKVTMAQKVDQLAKEIVQHINQTTVIGYSLAVDDVDIEGTATIAVRFESVNFTAGTPAGRIEYDSANPAALVPPIVSGLAALIGQTYSAKITADGVVKQVDGVKGILDAVLARSSAVEGVARIASEKALREQLSEQNLTQNLQNLFAPLPGHPVSIGDNWVRTSTVKLGLPLTVQSTYTLLSLTAGTATVEVTGSVATSHDSQMDLGPMKLSYDLKGEQNGSLQIVESTGQTPTAEISQHLSGSATLQGPNTDPITVFVTNYSTIKVERK
jgi:hypothetical protein